MIGERKEIAGTLVVDPRSGSKALDHRRVLVALLLFGLSFGYVEAAVVIYLRGYYGPLHAKLHPNRSDGDLFPLIRIDQLKAVAPAEMTRLRIEIVRELATLIMLAAVAIAAGRNPRQILAAFLVAFGIWDLAFYGALKMLIDWPGSLLTWDLLFLIPLPWTGPVIAPALVAVSMTAAGTAVLVRESTPAPIQPTPMEWGAIFAGGFVVVLAFCWDYRNIMAGGFPHRFNWPLFAVGEGVGLAGFLHASRAKRPLARRASLQTEACPS